MKSLSWMTRRLWSYEIAIDSIRMRLADAPTMLCQQTFAQVGDKSISVECEVRAKPEVSAVFWIIDMNGTTVSQGEVINDFWTTMLVSGVIACINELPFDGEIKMCMYIQPDTAYTTRRVNIEFVCENYPCHHRLPNDCLPESAESERYNK